MVMLLSIIYAMLMFFLATDYFTMWGIGVVSILCVIFIYTVVFIDSYYNVIVYGCLAKYSITFLHIHMEYAIYCTECFENKEL